MNKKIITFVISLIMIFSVFTVADAAISFRKPYNNYYSQQNPPDFSWQYEKNATYSLVIATDSELKNIKYRADNLKKNVYNFKEAFEPGVYYWSYSVNGGEYKDVYRFYIPESASEYVVPFEFDSNEDMERIIKSRLPDTHPRLLVNKKSLEGLRNDPTAYQSLWRIVESYISDGISPLPQAIPSLEALKALPQKDKTTWFSKYQTASSKASTSALLYLVTENEKYRDFAIRVLDSLCEKDSSGNYKWDPQKLFPWYSTTDVYETYFAYDVALAYDWVYDYLTETQKADITKLIELNLVRPYEKFAAGGKIEGSLYANASGSHVYSLNQAAIAALSIYEDSKLARDLANFHLPVMINISTPHSYQDGGFGQGLFYGISAAFPEASGIIKDLNIIDMEKKAQSRNRAYRYLYFWGYNQTPVFGDCMNNIATEYFQYPVDIQNLAARADSEIMRSVNKWLLNKATGNKSFFNSGFMFSFINGEEVTRVEEKEPYMLPGAKLLPDVGWASLNSSLYGDDRINLRFKSSPYGSYNHSHADQNGFTLFAYGENILDDLDYYTVMGSPFDDKYNRQTWVHNTITYDGGKGQAKMNSNADGKITDFLYFPEFDVVKGSAKNAYNLDNNNVRINAIDKADRTIVYLKPDVFVVIDDLKSANGEKNFEFWLNTQGEITLDEEDSSRATVRKNEAYVFADVVTPAVTGKKYGFIETPDGTEITANDLAINNLTGDEPDNRMAFITDKTEGTKMVTILSVSNEPSYTGDLYSEEIDGVIKITAGEKKLYINNTGKETVTIEGITFTGDAAVVTGYMAYGIINGTRVEADGITYIESDVPVTAAVGSEKVTISSLSSDATVKMYTGEARQIHKTEDEREVKLQEYKTVCGVKYITMGEYTEFEVYPSHYILNINDALPDGYGMIEYYIEGKGKLDCDSNRTIEGEKILFKVVPDEGYYVGTLSYNGIEVTPNSNGEYLTPEVYGYNSIYAEFLPVTEDIAPEVKTSPNVFTYDTEKYGLSAIIYGNMNLKGFKVNEYGVIYSTEKDEFTLEDVNGQDVKKLKGRGKSPLGEYGIEIFDSSSYAKDTGYARTYLKTDYGTVYGNIISFGRTKEASDARIQTLTINDTNIQMYPEFSPDVYDYILYSPNKVYDDFTYALSEGATATESYATDVGESTVITVTSKNGAKQTYNFRFYKKTNATGKVVASLDAYVQEGKHENSIVNLNGTAEKQYVYIYNYRIAENDSYGLVKIKISKVNPFANKIYLESAVMQTTDENVSGYEIYAAEDDYTWTEKTATYANTLGNGSVKMTEKLYECMTPISSSIGTIPGWDGNPPCYRQPEIDLTDYVKNALIEGKEYITLVIKSSDNTWPDDFVGEKTNSVIFVNRAGGSLYTTQSRAKLGIRWE